MSGAADRLAARLGILPRYADQMGGLRETGPDTRDALLAALGHDPAHAAEALAALEAAEAARLLPRWLVVAQGARISLPLDTRPWALTCEDGTTREGRGGALAPCRRASTACRSRATPAGCSPPRPACPSRPAAGA